MAITLANEGQCEDFKAQYVKFDYLWKKDLNQALQEFLASDGRKLSDGTQDDPELAKFEGQIVKYKGVATVGGGLDRAGSVFFLIFFLDM